MTETSSASGPEAAVRELTATAERVIDLAAKLGRSRDEVLNAGELHLATGVPTAVVESLLRGESAGEPNRQERFRQRLKVIQALDVQGNKRKHSQAAIARQTGISRQQINALANGERKPTMDHCALIETFFGRPAGFLMSEDAAAVNSALLLMEMSLLKEVAKQDQPAPTLATMLAVHGVEGIAARAALLPTDDHRDRVLRMIENLMAESAAETGAARNAVAGETSGP
ncbi:helix-turn-helix transcriptional regulator [Streptomyces sp. NPDC001502]|uniref:helix-turn-helix transcriptional regulator n=1 Tax=Streptomyces sp. NPDC001502 TaxID=3364578 RepID=UPI0036C3826D